MSVFCFCFSCHTFSFIANQLNKGRVFRWFFSLTRTVGRCRARQPRNACRHPAADPAPAGEQHPSRATAPQLGHPPGKLAARGQHVHLAPRLLPCPGHPGGLCQASALQRRLERLTRCVLSFYLFLGRGNAVQTVGEITCVHSILVTRVKIVFLSTCCYRASNIYGAHSSVAFNSVHSACCTFGKHLRVPNV